MTTPTPLPHAVAIQLCSDFDEASYRCGDPNHSPISCTCMKLVMTWRTMQRDLAAAQERALAAEARAGAFRSALLELRIRLHSAGRRPEECHEMSLIDAAIAEGK